MKLIAWTTFCFLIVTTAHADISSSAQSAYITQAAADAPGDSQVIFILDNRGRVFGFVNDPFHPTFISNFTRIKTPEKIKYIVPYVSIDANGDVYTWEQGDYESVEGHIEHITFTDAHKLSGISNVNEIVFNERHYAAISNGSDVYVWDSGGSDKFRYQRPDSKVQTIERKPTEPRRIFSDKNVKKVSINSWSVMVYQHGHEGERPFLLGFDTYFGYLILMKDGKLVGINTDSNGQPLLGKTIDLNPLEIGTFRGAKDILASRGSIAVIYDEGTTSYVNHCEIQEKDLSGNWVTKKGAHQAKGNITDVVEISKYFEGGTPNSYIKNDGTVWYEWPNSFRRWDNGCSPTVRNETKPIGFSPSFSTTIHKAIYIYGNLMIDEEHHLWTSVYSFKQPYDLIPISLPN